MNFTCPGKIFFLGEYSCLAGGTAFLGTCAPRFSLEVSEGAGDSPFHPQSPAGRLLKYAPLLNGKTLRWTDPSLSAIGVGSSSAQFLLTYAAAFGAAGLAAKTQAVLERYWEVSADPGAVRPSGADLVAQLHGGPVAVTYGTTVQAERLSTTALRGAEFLLAFTGQKKKTHEELKHLKASGFPQAFESGLESLDGLTRKGLAAWRVGDAVGFGEIMTAYQTSLMQAGFAPKDFSKQIAAISKWEGVLGAKGSGAQGGDCVLLAAEPGKSAEIQTKLRALGWQPSVVEWTSDGLKDSHGT